MRLKDKQIRAKQIVKKIIDDISNYEELEKAWDEIDKDEEKEIIKKWEQIIILNLPNGDDKDLSLKNE